MQKSHLHSMAPCMGHEKKALFCGSFLSSDDDAELPDASCGHFETLPKKKKKQDLQEDKKPLPVTKRRGHRLQTPNSVSVLLFSISGQGDNILATLVQIIDTVICCL